MDNDLPKSLIACRRYIIYPNDHSENGWKVWRRQNRSFVNLTPDKVSYESPLVQPTLIGVIEGHVDKRPILLFTLEIALYSAKAEEEQHDSSKRRGCKIGWNNNRQML